METFAEPKALVKNPHYRDQRRKSLAGLSDDMIDGPIIDLINSFNKLPYCFTLQSCHGHFVYNGQTDPRNLEPLPRTDPIGGVAYRIAYIAFCVENSDPGRKFLEALKGIEEIYPGYVQFCCAEWFWERQVNSFVLQVEPDRFKFEDKAVVDYQESLKIEAVRDEFFARLRALLQKQREP